MRFPRVLVPMLFLALLAAPAGAADSVLRERAAKVFAPLPDDAPNPANPTTAEKIELGRMLYYDARLSKNHDVSCNSCHRLDAFGVDGEPTSPGHKGQRGGRNSPTTLNAALHVAQFWDGRSPDLEDQAKGPVLNPVEMAMPDAAAVEVTLRSIPGYREHFATAFPGQEQAVSFDNMALAIAVFERGLLTPGPFDAYLGGDDSALEEQQLRGLQVFMDLGCITCHNGAAIGGGSYQKLGLVHPYETADAGRKELTGRDVDEHVFKVPALRNVARTGPYFHDGSVATLQDAARKMAWHQLGTRLTDAQVANLVAFLESLTGELDAGYAARPALPPSGPETPGPDPS